MFEKNSYLVEDLLLKLSLCPTNKQIQIFEEYSKTLPEFIVNQVKIFLINNHPFVSDELNEILNKSNDKLDDNINLSSLRIKAKKI